MTTTVEHIAAQLHEAWRAPRRLADGTFTERLKDDGAGGVVDIANTAYPDLPAQWQADNRAAAHAVHARLGASSNLEEVAAGVHVDWLERNSAWAEPHQRLPYARLTEAEKEKDREVVRVAAAVLGIALS